jgi:hypothetical protein
MRSYRYSSVLVGSMQYMQYNVWMANAAAGQDWERIDPSRYRRRHRPSTQSSPKLKLTL